MLFGSASSVSSVFEALETRQLFSNISVTDFGARPNDGIDDLAAIQAAIKASQPGDSIVFDGGTFDLSGELTIAPNRNYMGYNGATLRGRGAASGQLVTLHGDYTAICGLTFDGGGLFIDHYGGGFNQNILVDYDTFKINTSGTYDNGISFTSGLQNSKISNCYFTGYTGGFGIYGYNYNTLVINNNEFVNVTAGLHIDAFTNSGNLLVEQNYITGAEGMGMEFQSSSSNDVFQDNWFEHPNLSTDPSQNGNSMAFSLILDKSSNITIQRNTVIAPEKPDGTGCRIGFEVGGDNTLVEQNYLNGINNPIAMTDGAGTASVTAQNNLMVNYAENPVFAFPATGRSFTQINNGPNVQLNWDINRGKPGIGTKRYGGVASSQPPTLNPTTPSTPTTDTSTSTTPTTPTTPITVTMDTSSAPSTPTTTPSTPATPTTTPVTLPTDATYLSDLSWSGVSNGWGPAEKDMSNGEQAAGDGHTITIDGNTYAKGLGVHANSWVSYQLNGQYSNFTSDVGVDDETKGLGSVVFQVWSDGVKLYDSGTMKGGDAAKGINIDVTGRTQLLLICSGAGSDVDNDHADWAGARLTATTAAPTAPTTPITATPDISTPDAPTTDDSATPATPDTTTSDPAAVATIKMLQTLTPVSVTNGWGPMEVNRSNGEMGAADGHTITLNGRTYSGGLGVHAGSKIVYNLNGQYTKFASDIGVDDEVGSNGSVVFQIWADGVKLYDSGTMTGSSDTQSAIVDVSGRQQLTLVVTNAGDGNTYDHADWASPILIGSPATAPTSGSSTGTTTQLSSLVPTSSTNGWGAMELNRSNGEMGASDGHTLTLNGTTYASGLGVHANSSVVYNLNGQYKTLTTDMGIDDEVGSHGSVVFQIWVDGVKAYDSGTMTGDSATKSATVDLTGANQLTLVVNDAGDNNYWDHADWAGAQLIA